MRLFYNSNFQERRSDHSHISASSNSFQKMSARITVQITSLPVGSVWGGVSNNAWPEVGIERGPNRVLKKSLQIHSMIG
jgi:hypothetical protein